MYKICVFAGTTEGRELIEFLSNQPVSVTVCVATEYGKTLMPAAENLTICCKRMNVDEIMELLEDQHFDLVIDATHPYAVSITDGITKACASTRTEYIRLLRKASNTVQDAVYVCDVCSAVDFLNNTEGNILLTTGSKELEQIKKLKNFSERVYARVLPMAASLDACYAAGLKPAHIIAMQGPFSEEMNDAMLHFTSASWLVTKDGGEAGGFEAKLNAAQKAGARLVIIGRPPQHAGISFSETVELLCKHYGCTVIPYVSVVGIGPGGQNAMTREVYQTIENSDCLIGAKRMLKAVLLPGQIAHDAILPEEIADFILTHHEYRHFTVVLSGDVGFYSGAKRLLPFLDSCKVEVFPGLSSLAYLCSRLKTSYEDVVTISLHGRNYNAIPEIRANARVFVLLGGSNDIGHLCQTLIDAGLGHVHISVGERLSYPDEKITQGTAEELAGGQYESLSVALIENGQPDAIVTHGLSDASFQRGFASDVIIPMTKSEVRSVCLSKLRLTERSICWDIGAGTGSVAIEMALQAKKGQVYAVEQKQEALELLEENKKRFSVDNLTVVPGCAPDVCRDLPVPTHAFIGGSSGNMKEIFSLLLRKNPQIRIVATAISLESIGELTSCMKSFPFSETEVISMSIAKDKKAGAYHLMTGQNPIYIFTMKDEDIH